MFAWEDQDAGAFSPPATDVGDDDLCQWMGGMSRQSIGNLLQELESGALLTKTNTPGRRLIQLTEPRNKVRPNLRKIDFTSNPGDLEEESSSSYLESELAPASDLGLSRGGSGGREHLRQGDFTSNGLGVKSGLQEIAAALRENGVFASPAATIAEIMVERGVGTPEEALDILTAVLAETSADAPNRRLAMGRAVARLKEGDWRVGGWERALQAAERERNHLYTSSVPPPSQPISPPAPAALLWSRTLEELELQLTRATFEQWLHDTEGLDFEVVEGGSVLVVFTPKPQALYWLDERLGPMIHQALHYTAELLEASGELDLTALGLEREALTAHFVNERGRLTESEGTAPHVSDAAPERDEVQELWLRLRLALHAALPTDCSGWLTDSQVIGFNGNGRTLVVRVPNLEAEEQFNGEYAAVVHSVLADTAPDVEAVRFVARTA
jgi:hypothetical protein